ncbi:rCG62023 [Rattus norvegicus]|uniref:RCG62023 n=1 Tax=Rattus norvegicus TaxID=10116 RepID=A6HBW7_RAT|nr:rCG62023 [Rattus norvegicus]
MERRKQYLPTAHFTLSSGAENTFSKKAPFIGSNVPVSLLITNWKLL